MALPSINYPKYKTTIPSTGEIVSYKPFTVADEKLLLTAQEADSVDDMVDATKQLIENCFDGIKDVNKLTTYDIEFLFLQLRIKSISPVAELFYRNMQCGLTGEECEKSIKITVNLEDVKVVNSDGKPYIPPKKSGFVVQLTDDIGITLKHPGITERSRELLEDTFGADELIKSCIISVYDTNGVYVKGQDFTEEELELWYDGLDTSSRNKAREFLNDIPELRYDTEFVCKECGFKEKITLRGLEDFFG